VNKTHVQHLRFILSEIVNHAYRALPLRRETEHAIALQALPRGGVPYSHTKKAHLSGPIESQKFSQGVLFKNKNAIPLEF
jgi:hypothetical protein